MMGGQGQAGNDQEKTSSHDVYLSTPTKIAREVGPAMGPTPCGATLAGGCHGFGNELCEVESADLLVLAQVGNTVLEHRQAEWTGGANATGSGLDRLLAAVNVDALADVLFHPEAAATSATTDAP